MLYFWSLATVQPYRIQLAALLALLYLFIVTPVQYWHRHESTVDAITPASQHGLPELTESDANCAICTHSYAVSSNDAVAMISTANFFYTVSHSYDLLLLPTDGSNGCSNKSPPAAI